MIKNFTIKNFRCFKELKVEGLSRLNLITGQNNVGKTALLEALLLMNASSNIKLFVGLDKMVRGVLQKEETAEAVWGWFFHEKSFDKKIEFHFENEVNQKLIEHHVSLALEIPQFQSDIKLNQSVSETEMTPNTLISKVFSIQYKDSNHQHFKTEAVVLNGDVKQKEMLEKNTNIFFPAVGYISNFIKFNPKEEAMYFSELVQEGKQQSIVDALKIIKEDLVNIEIITPGGFVQLCADIGISTKIPINYLGDGTNKLLSILLRISTVSKNGYLFIDEMENGFHYSVMPTVWKIIADFAEEHDVQIIATTHSREFVQAAYQMNQDRLQEKKESIFGLYRLDRIKGNIKLIHYNESALETSFELGWEVR